MEHVTTKRGVELISSLGPNVVASITPHHLVLTTDDVLGKPHNYCLPVAKSFADRECLLETALCCPLGKFFFGSDSALHHRADKERLLNPAAGIFNAPVSFPMLCGIFHQRFGDDFIAPLENFSSRAAARFFNLPLDPEDVIAMEEGKNPCTYSFDAYVSFPLGGNVPWRVAK
jgi:dihydroorotase